MEQEIFQKAAFFSGKGNRHSIYRGFSCSGIKGKLIPFQAYILLNKFPPGKASDSGFQLLEVKGFGKIIIGAQIQTVYFIFNLIPGRQDQNRGIRIVFPELAENFQTVRAGKIQIQQDQVIIFCIFSST